MLKKNNLEKISLLNQQNMRRNNFRNIFMYLKMLFQKKRKHYEELSDDRPFVLSMLD